VAAAGRPVRMGAVVSRGGRPDLAGDVLPVVQSPTLLLVGGKDEPVIGLNQQALAQLGAPEKQLAIVPRGLAPIRGAGEAGRGSLAGRRVVHAPPRLAGRDTGGWSGGENAGAASPPRGES
jgi:hypothetical protein